MRFVVPILVALSGLPLSSCTEEFEENLYRVPESAERLGCSEACAHVRADWPMPHPPDSGLPNAASYSASDGVVTDGITHLKWESRPRNAELTWEGAARYCESLELGGAADWRLPSVIELMSLIDFTQSPMIDNRVFSATSSPYWTVQRGTESGTYWTLSFRDGSTNDAAGRHDGAAPTTLPVRCVR